MTCNKKHIFFYIICLIIQTHNLISSDPNASIEKDKIKMLQLVCENQQVATECQTIFETIIRNAEKIEQYKNSVVIFNQISIDLDFMLEQQKSFNMHEASEQQLAQTFQDFSKILTSIEVSVQSILSFIQDDIQTYYDTIGLIKADIKLVEENTPLKKSKYLQFFNATKQLESAIQLFKNTHHDFDDWLASTTESILSQNSFLKNQYVTIVHALKDKINQLKINEKLDDFLFVKIKTCKHFLNEIKQKLDAIVEQNQQNNNCSIRVTVDDKQTIDQIEKQIIKNIQSQQNQAQSISIATSSQKSNPSQLKKQQAQLKEDQKQRALQEKIKQKEEKKQKKAKEQLNKKQLKQSKCKHTPNRESLDLAAINQIDQHKHDQQESNIKELVKQEAHLEKQLICEEKSIIKDAALSTQELSIQEQFITAQKENNVLHTIEKIRNQTLYKLQDLQYYEEKIHLLIALFQDQEIAAQEQINNVIKKIDLLKNIVKNISLDQEKQDYLCNIYNQQQHHANNIQQENEKIEQEIIALQTLKEQHTVTQELFFKAILLTCNNALKELQDEQCQIAIKELEDEHHEKILFYKKESASKKNALLQQQISIQNELQALKNLESAIEKTIYETDFSQEKYKMLLPTQIEEARLLEQVARSQQSVEQSIDTLCNIMS